MDMEREDTYLIRDYRNGDNEAFSELFDRYKSKVYNFIYRLVGNPDTADDLTMITFIKAMKSIRKYRERGKFRNWLYSIANSVTIDYLRKSKREQFDSIDDWMDIPDDSFSPETMLEQKELIKLLEDRITTLAVKQRQVFVMRQETNMSFKEIAKVLNCPLPTVLSRMHNAVLNIKKSLRGYGYEV